MNRSFVIAVGLFLISFAARAAGEASGNPGTPRPASDALWRTLLDTDHKPKTSWEGYDFILNRSVDGQETWLEKNTGGWNWKRVAKVSFTVRGAGFKRHRRFHVGFQVVGQRVEVGRNHGHLFERRCRAGQAV